jgi:enoyl-CoA hydratase
LPPVPLRATPLGMPITTTLDAGVALLRLDLGRGNAINPAFIGALDQALDALDTADVRAVVLTGQGRVFCAGLDLPGIFDFDRAAAGAFVDAFDALFVRVLRFPKPVVAAINGHAIAGGCILAMAADYRIIAPGPHLIGINEVLLGIPFPAGTLEVARHALPPSAWADAFLAGRRYTPEESVRIGLVHRLAGEAGVVADALEQARAFAVGTPEVVAETKAALLAPVVARIEARRAEGNGRFVDRWLDPDARARIGQVVGDLARKKG